MKTVSHFQNCCYLLFLQAAVLNFGMVAYALIPTEAQAQQQGQVDPQEQMQAINAINDDRAKLKQAQASLQQLEFERTQTAGSLKTLQAARAALEQNLLAQQKSSKTLGKALPPASAKTGVLNTALKQYDTRQSQDLQSLARIDQWIRYWQGQEQTEQWNIAQDGQQMYDQVRFGSKASHWAADEQATREGAKYYARKNYVPPGSPFASDGWTSIPIRTSP